jgi:hypothetical protein
MDETYEVGLLVAYTPFAIYSPHYETELEIIQNHLEKGGKVVVLSCFGQLITCMPNPKHDLNICALCQSRFKSGIKWLVGTDISYESFYYLTEEQELMVQEIGRQKWRDIDEIRSFRIEGVDIGLAAISSLVDIVRDSDPDIIKYQEIVVNNIVLGAIVYYSIKNKLIEKKPDILLLFNGRFSMLRPALRAAQQLGIKTYVHERSGQIDRYSMTKNTYPHDLIAIKKEIQKVYLLSELSEEHKKNIAFSWFNERQAGIDQSWHSYTKNQIQNLLPKELDSNKINIVIFISSEDEFVAIEEMVNPFYRNQNIAIEQFMDSIAEEDRCRIFLRVHPNLKYIRNTQTNGIAILSKKYSKLQVIPADSLISSYALIKSADVIVTYGSTIGIEASYEGKLSVLMGRAIYEDLDVCIRPKSHDDFILLMKNIINGKTYSLPCSCQIGLIKYGLFNKIGGYKYKYLNPNGLFSAIMVRGNYKTVIKADMLTRLHCRLKRIYNLIKINAK